MIRQVRFWLHERFERSPEPTEEVRERRTMMLRGLGVVLLLIVAFGALWSGVRGLLTVASASALERGDAALSASLSRALVALSPGDDYLPRYNLGTAYVAQELWQQGVDELETALRAAPDEIAACPVRINLALAYRGLGNEYLAAGDPMEAEYQFRAALNMVWERFDDQCFQGEDSDGQGGSDSDSSDSDDSDSDDSDSDDSDSGDSGGDSGGQTGGDSGGDSGGQTGGDSGGDSGGQTGGDSGGDSGGQTGGDSGGDSGGQTGGDSGGDSGGQTGGQQDGSQGGQTGGQTGGQQGGDSGGQTGGQQGGDSGGQSGGQQGGDSGGQTGGQQGGDSGGQQGGSQGGQSGGQDDSDGQSGDGQSGDGGNQGDLGLDSGPLHGDRFKELSDLLGEQLSELIEQAMRQQEAKENPGEADPGDQGDPTGAGDIPEDLAGRLAELEDLVRSADDARAEDLQVSRAQRPEYQYFGGKRW